MNLIYLHGPPASGKLTIARELAAQTGCGVFHNHLTMEVVKPFFEFDSKPFWSLVLELRLTSLRSAQSLGAGTVVYTSCYCPSDLSFFEEMERVVEAPGGKIWPVYLKCSVAELERRVTDPGRAEYGKLRSVAGLRAQLARWDCVAVPRAHCIAITTEGRTPADCAGEIVARLGA